jgi:hypothetical protein
VITLATSSLTCGRALSMMARSRRTRSLKSITQPSSSVTGCEPGISESAPRKVAKKPGTLRRGDGMAEGGCGSI